MLPALEGNPYEKQKDQQIVLRGKTPMEKNGVQRADLRLVFYQFVLRAPLDFYLIFLCGGDSLGC